ncbi:hypothetical protein HWB60_gp037 [Mycobacterium phage TChen]|uniref:Uncharacterized protein n=1 Tax=Mycobacterium phage TChen TaxID=2163598 RepID=A0A2S1PD64_9CAUD|nr:hypothetical protein HWB60_gp037 [Mycobacterium phage TChen]AWH14495.1 hypothetical protein SEA_TCHEN_37 [Mycobacterium phage TChen]
MRLMKVTWAVRWKQTTCGHCPNYQISTLGGWRGRMFDPLALSVGD